MLFKTDDYKEHKMATSYQELTPNKNVRIEIQEYTPANGIGERHIMVHATNPQQAAKDQIESVVTAYQTLLEGKLSGYTAVFRRFFVSDAANQEGLLADALGTNGQATATSVVEQAPLNGTKIALWAYFVENVTTQQQTDGLTVVKHGDYNHYWGGTRTLQNGNSEQQTSQLLNEYANQLDAEGMTLEHDCIRTWFMVQNVDVNYAGMVKARNDVFDQHNLIPGNHFITSTGIGGRTADSRELVQMNTYAVKGLSDEQINFLYAKDHLNSTADYGVRFERGTYVDYGDRRHIFISGTASIDNKGNVLYVGDIEKQVYRMWENVEALLKEGQMNFDDLGQILVYLRDPADYATVSKLFDEKFPTTPKVIVLAPVCRPTWLIEMECMGVKEMKNEKFKPL